MDQSRAPNTLANQGGKVENAYLRVRTTTANVMGVLPGPAHQASDSKFHQWCHERRLSPEVGQWLIYMIAGTWLESNTSVKGPDADFISDSGDPHPLCVTKVGHLVGYLRQRFKIRGVSHEAL